MKISELLSAIERFAPLGLALSWDNVGLLLGEGDWDVTKVLVTLDVTPNVVEKAIKSGCQLILSHHPLIFRPLKSITDPLLIKLLQHQIAVISLHTNLDVAHTSVNHLLAKQLKMNVLDTLSAETGGKHYHITVSSPVHAAQKICAAAWNAGAGKIGNYANCAKSYLVQGHFSAESGAKPYLKHSEGAWAEETALQFSCDSFCLPQVLAAIRKAHPYETPALDHYVVENPNPAYGLGLICAYDTDHSLHDIAEMVRTRLNCKQLKLWIAGKKQDTLIKRIALCGGSGASVLAAATAKAELFISGDISYHSFLESRIPIIDAGHFYTEYPVLNFLDAKMQELKLDSEIMPMAEHEYAQGMLIL
ncbi:MAG: Nif3-like dinuclear metal center hexameric protein [Candidatus Cloacimonas sp.]|jgi:dinuclear metal center YbgI/SA1388 family protein|nr:Nif3-like dinuclear metal center hexameric protein [Candidatus Cloacimonas sp.]